MRPFFIVLGLLFSLNGFAQDWEQDYKEALATATAEEKPLILVFSGSDWCPPCKRLSKSILTSEEFISYSSENYVLYNADFPRKKANQLPEALALQNKELAERYNPKGHYPKVLVLNASEEVLGQTGYKKMSPKEYIAVLNSFL